MPRSCELCGRSPSRGNSITRRGMAKKKGGVGRKVTGITRRSWRPNIQRVRALVHGRTVRLQVCTTCLRSGRVVKPA